MLRKEYNTGNTICFISSQEKETKIQIEIDNSESREVCVQCTEKKKTKITKQKTISILWSEIDGC